MSKQTSTDGSHWRRLSAEVYAQVEREFPVEKAKRTHTMPDGRVVNMDREAMLARLYGVGDVIRGTVTGTTSREEQQR
jgi:hypothetical protein